MRALTDEMRFARFSKTVGEMQGELQFPPESKRKGRRCKLIPCKLGEAVTVESDDRPVSRYDETAECLVVYLEAER